MRKKLDLLILLIVLVVGFFAARNAQAIGDWWHQQQYSPPTDIVQLADAAGMSETGRQLFYRFEPQIVSQSELDSLCSVEKLGCIEGRKIYLLQPANQTEANRTTVTAAHEMLHAAYSRLSSSEKQDLEPLLQAEMAKPAAASIAKELQGYDQADYYNEAHSFIGSELPGISAELESHYSRYFDDRAKTTAAYRASPED